MVRAQSPGRSVVKAQWRVELVREMAPARSCRSPGPRLDSGHLAVVGSHGTLRVALWPREENPGWLFRCWDPEPGVQRCPPPPRAADRCRLPCFPQGYSGCTSAMSAETSRCSLQTSPSMEPFQGHWAGSSPFHLKQTGGVHLPAEFTARWLANGGTREGGTRGRGQLRAGPRPVDPRELG